MVLGFNHNVQYKGELFHVQTEDSGIANPHIITLLYRGGVIISSKKTSYSDILKMDKLEVVVEELMKEQHKEMMRRLKAGDFDEKAFSIKAQLIENYEIPTLAPETDPIAELFPTSPSLGTASKGDVSLLFELPEQKQPAKTEGDVSLLFELSEQPTKTSSAPQGKKSEPTDANSKVINLDEAILSFFGPREK
jgi:hypothetical protein